MAQNHRVFIAINLPKNIRERISSYQKGIGHFPIKWVKEDSLHITLIFLGYLKDEEVARICEITREFTLRAEPFSIELNKIGYGPAGKMPPRMIWLSGEKSQELANFRASLENEIFSAFGKNYSEGGTKQFSPHITLGRIRQWEWRRIDPDEMPQVEEEVSLDFEARSIEVMESHLKRGGSEYVILESCPLKE